jgi:hypothetical protein
VFINGKAAPLDAKNRFDATVTPIGFPPLVIFRMAKPSQPDVVTVRTLRRGK